MQISTLTFEAGDRMAKACQMLICGVAFQKDGQTWDVFSCWGDHLGSLSTHMIGNVNRFMKHNGKVGLFNHSDYSYVRNGVHIQTVTFSRAGWDQVEQEWLLENMYLEENNIL